MIRYDRLWATMEACGMTQYKLIKQHSFSAGQIGRLKKNMHVSTHTLDTLCTILNCGICDIIEFMPEGEAPILPLDASLRPKPDHPETDRVESADSKDAARQKKPEASKAGKPKKAGKSKKGEKKASKEGKKAKDNKKNK